MAAHAIAAAALSLAIYRSHCGAYLAGTDFQISIAGADCRARHAAGTNCRAYLAGTDFHIYIAGADCRAHHAAGTDCGAYIAGTDFQISIAGADCRAHHAAITGTGSRAHHVGPRACHTQSHPMVCGSSHPTRSLRSGGRSCR
jgi:hypothetical protein